MSSSSKTAVDLQNVYQDAEDLVMELDRNDDLLFHDPTIKHLMLSMQMQSKERTEERDQREEVEEGEPFDGVLWTHMRKSEMMDMMRLNDKEEVANDDMNGVDVSGESEMTDGNENDGLNVSAAVEETGSGGTGGLQDAVLEPVECEGLRLLLPIDLLRFPQVLDEIFSMKTWNERLSDEERAVLRRFLPLPPSTVHRSRKGAAASFSTLKEAGNESGAGVYGGSMGGRRGGTLGKKMASTQQSEQQNINWYNKTLETLFSGGNFNFGNDVQRFKRNLLAGQYHPLVYRQRHHVLKLKRLDFKINHELFLNKVASSLSRKYGSRHAIHQKETSQQVDEEQLVLAGRYHTLMRFAALQARALGHLPMDDDEEEEYEVEDDDEMVDVDDSSEIEEEEEAFSDEEDDEDVSVGEMDDDDIDDDDESE